VVVQTLVQFGADINQKTHDRQTAISLAKQSNHNIVVMLLKQLGAVVEEKEKRRVSDTGLLSIRNDRNRIDFNNERLQELYN